MKLSYPADKVAKGTIAAFLAYACWGLFPLFWKQLGGVDSLQILSHRFIWAAVFCVFALLVSGKLDSIRSVLNNGRRMALMAAASALIIVNWGVYIVAVNGGRITESALGYYINPLFSVALGVLFAGEKMDFWTAVSVTIATIGIIGAASIYGSVPWISLILASTFGVYGLIKKKAGLDPMVSLAVETLLVTPFALAYLASRQISGTASFISSGPTISILLVLAGFVTAVPLVFFAVAANSISLQRMGFVQYLSPTIQLVLGVVVYGEVPEMSILLTLASVLVAVSVYIFSRKKVKS